MTALDRAELIKEVARLTAERDRARDIAVVLEQQTAEALRITREAIADDYRKTGTACERIVRLLGDDDE